MRVMLVMLITISIIRTPIIGNSRNISTEVPIRSTAGLSRLATPGLTERSDGESYSRSLPSLTCHRRCSYYVSSEWYCLVMMLLYRTPWLGRPCLLQTFAGSYVSIQQIM